MGFTVHKYDTNSDGAPTHWLSCVQTQHWVEDAAEATVFQDKELAYINANDWSEFYAAKGYPYRCAVGERVQ